MLNDALNALTRPPLAYVPGWLELVVVMMIFLLLFGNRLPGTMRSLGQSLTQFKKGMKENEDDKSGTDSDRLH